MKRVSLILILIVALLLMGANTIKLVRLELVNKSGYEVALSLNGVEYGQMYYIPVPVGDRVDVYEGTYTIIRDEYVARVVYLLDGQVISVSKMRLDLTHQSKFTFVEPVLLTEDYLYSLVGETNAWRFSPAYISN